MITSFDKALVALILAILSIVNIAFGFEFPEGTEAVIGYVIAIAMPFLVWITPNRPMRR